MRDKESLSVHATGRAVDLSYRHVISPKDSSNTKGIKNGRREAVRMCKLLVDNADLLGLEALFDYFPAPHGRAWMCDRDAWSTYKKATISGAPKGDWLHLELSPEMADSPVKVREAFAKLVLLLGAQSKTV
jgi:hypothetical protein